MSASRVKSKAAEPLVPTPGSVRLRRIAMISDVTEDQAYRVIVAYVTDVRVQTDEPGGQKATARKATATTATARKNPLKSTARRAAAKKATARKATARKATARK
jgi:hypothetical protein